MRDAAGQYNRAGLPLSDPLVLDLDGDGIELTPQATSFTLFDIDGDGEARSGSAGFPPMTASLRSTPTIMAGSTGWTSCSAMSVNWVSRSSGCSIRPAVCLTLL